MKFIVGLLCVLLLSGCASGMIIPEPTSIRVPTGLSVDDARSAIAAALDVKKDGDNTWSFERRLGGASLSRGRQHNWWYPEDYGDGVVYAGFSWRSHYLQAAIHYDSRFVRVEITDSRNLKQSKKRIHAKALQLIGKLEDRIRLSLGALNAEKSGVYR